MPIKSQLLHDTWANVGTSPSMTFRWGQRLTISNRIVSAISFYLSKVGTEIQGGAPCYVEIRKVSDDGLIASKDCGLWSDFISGGEGWYTVTFDSPVLIDEEVRIYFKSSWSIGGQHYPRIAYQNSDVAASELLTRNSSEFPTEDWVDDSGADLAYQYTYTTKGVTASVLPNVMAILFLLLLGLALERKKRR